LKRNEEAEEIQKSINNDQDKENLSKIEYHIYDIIDTQNTFEKRNERLNKLFESHFKMIKNVCTIIVLNEKEIQNHHLDFVNEQGYEGTMIRNKSGMYKEKYRSFDLLKFKDFQDEEFEIINYTFEKDTSGEDKNLIVWIVQVKDNITCKIRPQGTKEQRKELYEQCQSDFSKFKGRKLWSKFFEYTSDGNLRFPTTKTKDVSSYIRDEII
jgi:ATP-dependent DNA ligase